MAYLPPAGIRQLTAHKKTHLATMSEIPNPMYFKQNKNKPTQTNDWLELPPLKNRDADWPPIARPKCPPFSLYDDGCSARCQCVRPPVQLGENASHIGKPMKDPRELPYGLPPISYDCKRRADWFGNWQNHMAAYSGSYALWEQKYGDMYYYTKPLSFQPETYSQCHCV